MSNGIFNTSRQLSVEERVQALVAQKANRASARASLMEAATDAENKKKTEDELAKIDSDHEKDAAKEQRLEKLQEATFAANRRHDMMALESRLFQEGRQVLWNKILFETVYAANWVDDSVKQQIIQPMYETFESTMGFLKKTIPGAFTKNPTRLLEAMDTIVTETAKKAAKRITEEANADVGSQPARIPFNVNQDEEDDFDKSLADLSTDEIADKVKEKVLTVVQDEKKASKTKADAMKEIDEAKKANDDSDDTDDSSDDDGLDGDDSDDKDSKSKSKKKKKDGDDDEHENADSESDSGEDTEDDSTSDDSKSKSKGDGDDSSDDDDLDDGDDGSDDSDSKSKSKKKKGDDSDDDTESKSKKKKKDDDDDVTEGMAASTPSWKVALEQRILDKKLRAFNNSIGCTIFESMLMVARTTVERDAVLENVQMTPSQLGDAMLIEAITRYTVLETLNTLQIVNMSYGDATTVRKACLEEVTQSDPKIMSADNAGGPKTTRINTQKYKKNNDKKVMAAN